MTPETAPEAITVRVLLFAALRQRAGLEELLLTLSAPATVADAAAALEARGIPVRGAMAAVNDDYAAADTPLQGGDEVAFLPPISGGSGDGEGGDDTLLLTEEPLSPGAAQRAVLRERYGAQALFVGTVRSPNAGQAVQHLNYSAHAPMARKVMARLCAEARERHGELRVYFAHRLGEVRPGEASVVVAVGSPHRRAALEACDFLIESLKAQVPIWKEEVTEGGRHWPQGVAPAERLT